MRVPPLRGKMTSWTIRGLERRENEGWCDGYLALGCRHRGMGMIPALGSWYYFKPS